MIFDPDGEHAMTDDGRMAIRVFLRELDEAGLPTGERIPVGWADPSTMFGPLAGHQFTDEG